jgi:glutamate-ammonia-ligase adenylyltransferase
MQQTFLASCLDSPASAEMLLRGWNLTNPENGWQNLKHLADRIGIDALQELAGPLGRLLPRCPDPDMALNNLERFLGTAAGCAKLRTLLEGRARGLEICLQLLSTSQFFSDLLCAYPHDLDMLRVPLRRSPNRDELRDQLQADVDAAGDDRALLHAFRRFRQRHVLRIATNDIIRDRPLEEITLDLSRLADAALAVALETALRHLNQRFGEPVTAAGEPARCVILAFGKLGGEELNYSSDIDLMFLYDEDGATRGKRGATLANAEFFARVVSEVIRLISAHTEGGQAYRIDLRLRPEGQRGPLARTLASTLDYYDKLGRTWERQALIKVRPVAGHLPLAVEFVRAIESFVFRRYLSFGEINEIKAIKRRIEQKAARAGVSETEVKTGHGGIRDIEFTIQFLQLLNGGDLPDVRQRNTLLALDALERVGCLTDQEHQILDDAYRFLRKTEHRLQLLLDLQTHSLPDTPAELRKLALRMGYADATPAGFDSREAFLNDYREKTKLDRQILNHLLHQTFQDDEGAKPESDLILDPNPDPEVVHSVLSRYPFRDIPGAFQNLTQLAQESVPFLSTRRCRQFLASIAPQLLKALAETPDPDMALTNLEKVTASLGAKAVLWELFSFNPPSLKLYVDLCASSEFLSEVLINNPGMIDELLDSLVLNQPRTALELRKELADLCRGASDPEPILHSFQDKELLRIGVRDILGKGSIRETLADLSDLAETILSQIAQTQETMAFERFGIPSLSEGIRQGRQSRFVILGLGKLGGRELTYHSDLDLMLVYEGDGRTTAPPGSTRFDRFQLTDNFHCFAELTQKIIKATSYAGPLGRLYQVDMRLRPTGKSGSLVIPLTEFRRYYDEAGTAMLWERQAMTRARVVYGEAQFCLEVMQAVERAAYGLSWRPAFARDVLEMRQRLEASHGDRDLKRGFGGILDCDFLVQLFQLKYGGKYAILRTPNTWDALAALRALGLLQENEHRLLDDSYSFLRKVQSRLRIVRNWSFDDLPDSLDEIEKLARRLGIEARDELAAGECFVSLLEDYTSRTRELFLKVIEREERKR